MVSFLVETDAVSPWCNNYRTAELSVLPNYQNYQNYQALHKFKSFLQSVGCLHWWEPVSVVPFKLKSQRLFFAQAFDKTVYHHHHHHHHHCYRHLHSISEFIEKIFFRNTYFKRKWQKTTSAMTIKMEGIH